MAAGDTLSGKTRLTKQTRGGSVSVLLGERPYTYFVDLDVADAVYVNGGAPAGGGRSVNTAREALFPGEFLCAELKVASAKTEDSDHANNDILVPVTVRDLNTGALYEKVLTHSDRNTDILADDPALLTTAFMRTMVWKVPDGEAWEIGPGELRLRFASTA